MNGLVIYPSKTDLVVSCMNKCGNHAHLSNLALCSPPIPLPDGWAHRDLGQIICPDCRTKTERKEPLC